MQLRFDVRVSDGSIYHMSKVDVDKTFEIDLPDDLPALPDFTNMLALVIEGAVHEFKIKAGITQLAKPVSSTDPFDNA